MSMNLSKKASDFVTHTSDYGSISNKAVIIGEDVFPVILPFLASAKIRDDLEIPEPGELTPEIQGTLEFAEVIGVDEHYISKLYSKYLKSFLR
jgi:hypothetical protein